MAKPLHRADKVFIVSETFEVSPSANNEATLPIITNRGAPGG